MQGFSYGCYYGFYKLRLQIDRLKSIVIFPMDMNHNFIAIFCGR